MQTSTNMIRFQQVQQPVAAKVSEGRKAVTAPSVTFGSALPSMSADGAFIDGFKRFFKTIGGIFNGKSKEFQAEHLVESLEQEIDELEKQYAQAETDRNAIVGPSLQIEDQLKAAKEKAEVLEAEALSLFEKSQQATVEKDQKNLAKAATDVEKELTALEEEITGMEQNHKAMALEAKSAQMLVAKFAEQIEAAKEKAKAAIRKDKKRKLNERTAALQNRLDALEGKTGAIDTSDLTGLIERADAKYYESEAAVLGNQSRAEKNEKLEEEIAVAEAKASVANDSALERLKARAAKKAEAAAAATITEGNSAVEAG